MTEWQALLAFQVKRNAWREGRSSGPQGRTVVVYWVQEYTDGPRRKAKPLRAARWQRGQQREEKRGRAGMYREGPIEGERRSLVEGTV